MSFDKEIEKEIIEKGLTAPRITLEHIKTKIISTTNRNLKMNNLNFGQAIEALKDGKKVARAGWNGKGMHLKYIHNGAWCIASSTDEPLGSVSDFDPNYFLPWIGMKTADNKFVPWLASQTDMLAEDWTIVD